MLDAGRAGGLDRLRVQGDALRAGHVDRDQQQPLDAGERGLQPRGVGEVAAAYVGAARGERLERGGIAGQQDRLVPLVEQELGDAAAEVSGGSGDGDGGHA